MATALLDDHNHPQSPADTEVNRAKEELMVVWHNGSIEAEGLKLIGHEVPCFIISKVSSHADHRRAAGERSLNDFVEHSPVARLHRSCNPYDRAATHSENRLVETDRDVGIATTVPNYLNAGYSRASPAAQAAHSKRKANKEAYAGSLDSATGELLPPGVEEAQSGIWTYWMQTTMDDHCTPCLGE
ncbi:hypothetical protein HYPSUDRAFT_203289 [Hypholoma sublateritium FD-334 SS-4]|uniref:Uncharacterized protein n=1 Tax=Hypholoma sublateritium (strain FD-334 SS-4) TaxID=945553 RepID=A0A0D2PML7_HYPSF|nr:hypothetical protein HYPSUDRAFT_203289 [Hypholoma sublateritium FD-334 SS-4]